jgi:hypothetical protein
MSLPTEIMNRILRFNIHPVAEIIKELNIHDDFIIKEFFHALKVEKHALKCSKINRMFRQFREKEFTGKKTGKKRDMTFNIVDDLDSGVGVFLRLKNGFLKNYIPKWCSVIPKSCRVEMTLEQKIHNIYLEIKNYLGFRDDEIELDDYNLDEDDTALDNGYNVLTIIIN